MPPWKKYQTPATQQPTAGPWTKYGGEGAATPEQPRAPTEYAPIPEVQPTPAEPEIEDLPELSATLGERSRGIINPRLGATTRLDPMSAFRGTATERMDPPSEEEQQALSRNAAIIRASDIPVTPAGKAAAIKAQEPGAEFEIDPSGNWIVSLDGERYHLNKPGLSEQDMREVGLEVGIEAPLVLALGGLGGVALGASGRVAGVGGGVGAASVIRQLIGRQIGSGEEIDAERAAILGGMAAGFEVLGPILVNFVKRAVTNPRFFKDGALTKTGRDAFARAGIDPDTVTADFVERFQAAVREGDDVIAAGRRAQAESLPEPVPLTRGQTTDDPALLAFEGQFKKRGRVQGDNPLLDVQDAQQEAMRGNLRRARPEGGAPTAGEAGANVQARLSSRERAGRRLVNIAYGQAKERGKGASVHAESAGEFTTRARNRLIDDQVISPAEAPRTFRVLDDLETGLGDPAAGTRPTVGVNELESARKRLSAVARSAGGTPEGAAAKAAIREYDDWLREAIADDLINGDEAAIEAWQQARGIRQRVGQLFDSGDVVEALTERIGSARQLKVNPDEAANVIFGTGSLGGKRQLTDNLTALKRALGANSPEWQQVREAAFLRLLRNQAPDVVESTAREGGGQIESLFSGAKFATELNKLLEKPRAARLLFDEDEIRLMKQLRDVGLRIERRPQQMIAGDPNPSGTALANTMESILDRMGLLGKAAKAGVRFAGSKVDVAAERARSAARPSPTPRPAKPGAGLLAAPTNELLELGP